MPEGRETPQQPAEGDELRRRAESLAAQRTPHGSDFPPERLQELLHELEVHQIELEMQNEALCAAQAELEASRDRYADLYDFAPVGYVTLEGNGNVREFNLTAAAMLGTERHWLTGRSLAPYVRRRGKTGLAEHLARCRRAGETEEVLSEVTLVPRGREPLLVQLRSVPLTERLSGERVYRTAIVDLSELRRSEKELQRAKDLSDALNRINMLLHSTLDFDQVVERLVAEGAAALGSDTAAVSLRQGKTWTVSRVHGLPSSLIGARMNDDQERHAVLAVESRQPVAVADTLKDKRVNRKHLRDHNIRAVLVVPLIARNEPLGVILFNYHAGPHSFTEMEVSFAAQLGATAATALENARLFDERRRAHEALRQSEDRLRTLAEALPQIVWTANTEGAVDWFNRRWDEYTGQEPGGGEGWSWRGVVHADDIPRTLQRWQDARRLGSVLENELRLRGHDGEFRWFLARAWPLRDADGELVRWFGTYTDIHDLRQAQEALAAAKAAAEAANLAKSRFLANISHELRTPMNAILGMVDLALPKQVDPSARDFLRTARGSADLLLALLNDLLDSAKIEAGKLQLEAAPFSLRRVLSQTAEVLTVRAAEKGIGFSYHVPPDVPDALVGDQVRLRQVLLNLVGNGIKFTESGEVTVSVRACEEGVDEGLGIRDWGLEADKQPAPPTLIPNLQSPIPSVTLEFAVRDTGVGIPASYMKGIFQPFAQADPSTSRRFGGTGLGLPICATLVGMMGGRIWVESQPGHGSTFYFTLRLPVAEGLPAEPQIPDISPAATSALRVLLVEDNPANQKLAAYILHDRGHAAEIAGDGQQAVRMARENSYDVILMDLQMPGMDGLEATAAIRDLRGGGKRVPIIAMTAHALKADRDRCLAAGMDGYLSKPINAREMLGLIESLAEMRPGGPEIVPEQPAPPETPSEGTAVVFNPEEALAKCFHEQQMLEEMIWYFLDEVDDLLPQLYAAQQRGDLAEIGRLGHHLRGTVVYLGAKRASRAARQVERVCSSGGSPAEAEQAIAALEEECTALKAALKRSSLAITPTPLD